MTPSDLAGFLSVCLCAVVVMFMIGFMMVGAWLAWLLILSAISMYRNFQANRPVDPVEEQLRQEAAELQRWEAEAAATGDLPPPPEGVTVHQNGVPLERTGIRPFPRGG